jgi:hypothetical protein
MKNATTGTIVIAQDSCENELESFISWMSENYPDVKCEVENTMHGTGNEYWEEYCNA